MTEITKEILDEVLKKDGLAIIDFYGVYCGPCKMQLPILEKLSEEYSNVFFGKCDVEEHSSIASKYGIVALPSILIIKAGQIMDKLQGLQPKKTLEDKIKEYS